MGNCLCLRPPVTWVDDYDNEEGQDTSDNLIQKRDDDELSTLRKGAIASATEVRVKISKKQLEELLRRAEVKGMSTRDLMLDLINMSLCNSKGSQGHHWRPVLNSIAEEPEYVSGFHHNRSF